MVFQPRRPKGLAFGCHAHPRVRTHVHRPRDGLAETLELRNTGTARTHHGQSMAMVRPPCPHHCENHAVCTLPGSVMTWDTPRAPTEEKKAAGAPSSTRHTPSEHHRVLHGRHRGQSHREPLAPLQPARHTHRSHGELTHPTKPAPSRRTDRPPSTRRSRATVALASPLGSPNRHSDLTIMFIEARG